MYQRPFFSQTAYNKRENIHFIYKALEIVHLTLFLKEYTMSATGDIHDQFNSRYVKKSVQKLT